MFLESDSSTEILKNILLERKDYGFKIHEFKLKEDANYVDLRKFWKDNGIHTMYISSNRFENGEEHEIYRLAELHKVRISLIPSIAKNNFFQFDLGYIEMQPVLVRSKFPLDYLTNICLLYTSRCV